MDLKDHLKLEKEVRKVRGYLSEALHVLAEAKVPKSQSKNIWKAIRTMEKVRCLLDSDYYRVTTEDQRKPYGMIYYGGKKQ